MKKIILGLFLGYTSMVYAGGVSEKLRYFLEKTPAGQGRFVQKVLDTQGQSLVPESQGSFQFSRPGLFTWVYETPYHQRIRSDGKNLWLYDRDLAQVNQQSLTTSIPQSPATLLFGQGRLDTSQWQLKRLSDDTIRLIPKEAGVFRKVIIYFSNQHNFPQKMDLIDSFGQHTWIHFKNFQVKQFKPQDFQWSPPEGVDVLQM